MFSQQQHHPQQIDGGRGGGGYRGGGGGGRYQNRGSGGRYQNRGGGRDSGISGGRGQGNNYAVDGSVLEKPIHNLCNFFVSGSCQRGDTCRHLVEASITIPSQAPIKSLGLLTMPDGPKILSGSTDSTVKVWNLATAEPSLYTSIATTGVVEHIEVSGSTILWSVDEPLSQSSTQIQASDQQQQQRQDITVGIVYLFNTTDASTIPIKRSEEFPYTHPFGEIRSFKVAIIDGTTFVITGGGEGLIRTWRYDTQKKVFEQIMLLEGHIRAVTCIYLRDTHLWSGSVDGTIRVWDLSTGSCLGVLSSMNGGQGHTEALICLEYIPEGPEPLMASGSADGTVKIWKITGAFTLSVIHSAMVTALKVFKDSLGGIQVLLVGLLDGSIVIRSCLSMKSLFVINSSICHTKSIWSIVSLGQSCFSTGSEEGSIIVWRINQALTE